MNDVHLVTGGSGYFGSVLAHHLNERGLRTRIFDRFDAPDRPPEVELVLGDVRDRDAVTAALADVTVVHHNVAVVPLAKNRAAFWSVNRDGTRVVLEAAAAAGVRKVVHMSSSAVFGVPESNPVTEEMEPHPGEEYGKAKLAAEELCREAAAAGLDVTIIRPRTILGPGRLGIMQILFEWVRSGRNVPVLGRGENRYQFVHADDLAAACLLAQERPGADLFHIGAERFGTMRETLEALLAHAAAGGRVVGLPVRLVVPGMKLAGRLGLSPLGDYHALLYHRSLYFDSTRARDRLGWRARFSNAEMFCQAYDWYLAHRDEVLALQEASHHRSAVRQKILRLVSRFL